MRRVLRKIGEFVAVVVVLGAVAAVVLAGQAWPAPDARPAVALEVAVSAGDISLVCPSPHRLASADGDLDYDPAFDPMPAGLETTTTAVAIARPDQEAPAARWVPGLGPEGQGPEGAVAEASVPLGPQGAPSSSAVVSPGDGPGLLIASPVGDQAAFAAAATVGRTDVGDLRGLAATRCSTPVTSAWLLGGSTELGASARLVLANAGGTPATVTLDVWGATGPVETGQAGTVLVPAHSERVVLLEALAAEQPRLAVHLTADGGAVAPVLQDGRVNGFVPAGVDLAEPVAEPATTVVVPAVALVQTEPDAQAPAVLRVVNPGEEVATVALRLLGADGPVTLPGAETRVIDAGTVVDISLAGVPAGVYAAELSADVPVAAAVMLTRVGESSPDDPSRAVVDRAWVSGVLPTPALLLPAPGVGAAGLVDAVVVAVTNPGAASVDLRARAVRPDGALSEPLGLSVGAGATAVLDGERWVGALALFVEVVGGPGTSSGVVGASVLVAEAADGPLVAAVGAQEDLAEARVVAVRLPNR